MKKLLLLYLLLCPLWALAQNHVSVLGIPMGGELNSFVSGLKSKGFNQIECNADYGNARSIFLSGDFYGFKNCRIDVLQDNDLNVVTVVNVKFRIESYDETKILSMIRQLDKEYGKSESSSNDYSPDSQKTWTWTVYNVPIELTIKKSGLYSTEFFGQLHFMDVCFVQKRQDEEDSKMKSHIKFMGHYISEPSFVNNLKKDLKIWKDSEGSYRGEVGGYESLIEFLPYDFSINIAAIKITKPKYERWVDLKRTYQTYKDLFSKKYSLLRSNENTGIRYGSSLSESEFALRNIMIGDGTYSCVYEIPGGMILMSIEPKKGTEYPEYGEVVIYYVDTQNYSELKSKEEKEKLDDL